MANLEELYGVIGLDTAEFLTGLDEAQEGVDEFTESADSKLAALATGGLLAFGEALGTVGATAVDFAGQTSQSVNDLQAQLGLTASEAEAMGGVVKDVFANNFGDSIEDVTQATATVQNSFNALGVSAGDDLQGVVEDAFRLRDVFDIDVQESASAAAVLMSEFGLTAEEAYDFIAKGAQDGLNAQGDFLETISEYGNLFGQAEFSADQFYSTLESGAGAGVLGTDKVADAVKEANIRILEMNDDVVAAFTDIGNASFGDDLAAQFGIVGPFFIDTEEKALAAAKALGEMGLSVDPQDLLKPLAVLNEETGELEERAQIFGEVFMSEILGGVADGSVTMQQAQQLAIEGLAGMENQVHANSAAVKIFGTQAEDMGIQMLTSVDMAGGGLENMAGATESLDVKYNNLGSVIEGVWRNALIQIEPVGAKLLEIANVAVPYIISGMNTLGPLVSGAFIWLLENGNIVIPILLGIGAAVLTAVVPSFIAWATAAGAAALATLTAIAPLLPPLIAIGAVVALVAAAWANNWFGIRDKTAAVVAFLGEKWVDLQEGFNLVVTGAQTLYNNVVSAFTNMQTGAQSALVNLQTGAMSVWQMIYDNTWGKVVELWTNIIARFTSANPETVAKIIQLREDAVKIWNEIVTRVTTFVTTLWANIQTKFTTGVADGTNKIESFKTAAIEKFNALVAPVTEAVDKVKSVVGEKFEEAKTKGLEILGSLSSGITGLAQQFYDAASSLAGNVIDGFVQAIENGADAAVGALVDMATSAMDAAKDALGIQSPSTEMYDIGTDTWKGEYNALMEGVSHMRDAGRELGAAVMLGRSEVAMPDLSGSRQAIEVNMNGDIDARGAEMKREEYEEITEKLLKKKLGEAFGRAIVYQE